jgi:hypothetical protein
MGWEQAAKERSSCGWSRRTLLAIWLTIARMGL